MQRLFGAAHTHKQTLSWHGSLLMQFISKLLFRATIVQLEPLMRRILRKDTWQGGGALFTDQPTCTIVNSIFYDNDVWSKQVSTTKEREGELLWWLLVEQVAISRGKVFVTALTDIWWPTDGGETLTMTRLDRTCAILVRRGMNGLLLCILKSIINLSILPYKGWAVRVMKQHANN